MTLDEIAAERRRKSLARQRKYYAANKARLNEICKLAMRKRRVDDPDRERERDRVWKEANKEKCRARRLARYAADPEKRRAATYKWRKENPEKLREARKVRYYADVEGAKEKSRTAILRRKYGLTEKQYAEMHAAQNGLCFICGETEKKRRRLAVDHDHEHGHVRKLLCSRCNVMEGFFKNDARRAHFVAKYAEDNVRFIRDAIDLASREMGSPRLTTLAECLAARAMEDAAE